MAQEIQGVARCRVNTGATNSTTGAGTSCVAGSGARVQMPRTPVLRGKQDWERDIRPLELARRTCSPSACQCGRTSTAERHGASSPPRTFRLRGVRVATIVEVSSRGVSQQNHHGRVHHHTWLPLKAQAKVANTKRSNLI